MAFNENTRVKIPAILHLTQSGYEYVSLKNAVWDSDTNIFTDIFRESILRINAKPESRRRIMPGANKRKSGITHFSPNEYSETDAENDPPSIAAESVSRRCNTDDTYNADISRDDISNLLIDLKNLLDYEDLGRAFYNRLVSATGIRLIDFKDFLNNSFHVCTELTCKNGEDEFRPDITILINGMPLVFIEEAAFNCFREEDPAIFGRLSKLDEDMESFVLEDNNLAAIKDSAEYITSKLANKPTNRMKSLALLNADIFSVGTVGGEKVRLFGGISNYVTEESKRDGLKIADILTLFNWIFIDEQPFRRNS